MKLYLQKIMTNLLFNGFCPAREVGKLSNSRRFAAIAASDYDCGKHFPSTLYTVALTVLSVIKVAHSFTTHSFTTFAITGQDGGKCSASLVRCAVFYEK